MTFKYKIYNNPNGDALKKVLPKLKQLEGMSDAWVMKHIKIKPPSGPDYMNLRTAREKQEKRVQRVAKQARELYGTDAYKILVQQRTWARDHNVQGIDYLTLDHVIEAVRSFITDQRTER